MNVIRLHPRDNVAVALEDVAKGEQVSVEGVQLTAAKNVQRGHKLALAPIPAGEKIVKYGCDIGVAKEDIAPGQWVHVHNVRTGLSEGGEYCYDHKTYDLPTPAPGPSGATAGRTAGPPSATSCGSSPPWAVSTPSPSVWCGRTSTW